MKDLSSFEETSLLTESRAIKKNHDSDYKHILLGNENDEKENHLKVLDVAVERFLLP